VADTERTDRPPSDDAVAARLGLLAQAVTDELGDVVAIERESIPSASVEGTRLVPHREGACYVYWAELDSSELVLQVGDGGRWELNRDLKAVERIERIVQSVINGRVTEVFGPARSQVTVTLDDVTTEVSTGYRGLLGAIPMPSWKDRGRVVAYDPYRSSPT
jgi:hypothetical protein